MITAWIIASIAQAIVCAVAMSICINEFNTRNKAIAVGEANLSPGGYGYTTRLYELNSKKDERRNRSMLAKRWGLGLALSPFSLALIPLGVLFLAGKGAKTVVQRSIPALTYKELD